MARRIIPRHFAASFGRSGSGPPFAIESSPAPPIIRVSFIEEEVMHSGKFGVARAAMFIALLGLAAQAQAVTAYQWWHAMSGANNERVNSLAKRFSHSQSEYNATAVYNVRFPEAMA